MDEEEDGKNLSLYKSRNHYNMVPGFFYLYNQSADAFIGQTFSQHGDNAGEAD